MTAQKQTYAVAAEEAAERRRGNRHMFTAAVEVTEISSGARFSARTTDLGPGGCFVDTLVPFPVGARVRLAVRKAKRGFETEGGVVYSQQGLGMGIAFDRLSAKQREELNNWIEGLGGVRFSAAEKETPRAAEPGTGPDRSSLLRLVNLLVTKGLLTGAEAASVFFDSLV